MEAERARFLAYVPAAGAILDAGCGSGRDALAMSRAGYAVTAFDGSAEMARLASRHAGLPVRHMTFEQMDWDQAFDGVWACASLLHLKRAELPGAFQRILRALRPGGVFYASFKLGHEERGANGRHFTDLTGPLLSDLISNTGLAPLEVWTTADERPDHPGEDWVSAMSRRPVAVSLRRQP